MKRKKTFKDMAYDTFCYLTERPLLGIIVLGTVTVGIATSCSAACCSVIDRQADLEWQEKEAVAKNDSHCEPTIMQPYEHVFFKRFTDSSFADDVYFGQVDVPEGYEVLGIEYVEAGNHINGNSETVGFDIWFTNTKTVEVQPVFNEKLLRYEYSEPGVVVVQELEEDSNTLSKSL